MQFRDIGKYIIPFTFNDRKHVLKVTKYTTCDDVIEMILHKEGIRTSASLFTMSEGASGVERRLPGRSLVVNAWRSRDCESKHFQFIIRRKQPAKRGLRLKHLSQEPNTDDMFRDGGIYRKGSKETMTRIDNSSKIGRRTSMPTDHVSIANQSSGSVDSAVSLLSKASNARMRSKCSSFILSKFFNDILKTTRRKRRSLKSTRQKGDGADMSLSNIDRHGDGAEDPTVMLRTNLYARCQLVWDKNSMSDTDSDTSGEFTDDDEDTFIRHTESGKVNSRENLDKAFIGGSCRDSDSDEGIDVTSVRSIVDLDTAFVGDLELSRKVRSNSCTINDESNSDDGFDHNISNDDYVRELFGCHGDITDMCEDDIMDSFMRSRLDSF